MLPTGFLQGGMDFCQWGRFFEASVLKCYIEMFRFRLVGDRVVRREYWELCLGERGSTVKAVTAGHKYV